MRKTLLILTMIASLSSYSQTTIFEDGFETYTDFSIVFAPWINIDVDGLATYADENVASPWVNSFVPMAFQVFNPTTAGVTNSSSGAELRNYDPHGGSKYAVCWAASPPTGSTVTPVNNDWLISPAMTLGTANTLSFWVKSLSSSYGLEKYKVAIFIGAGIPDVSGAVTYIAGNPINLTAPYGTWQEKVFPVGSSYENQIVRFGIRCVSSDAYMFMVDDFKVSGTITAGLNDVLANKFSMFPNPANNIVTISNTENILVNTVNITDVNGRIVLANNYNGVNAAELNVSELNAGIYFININTSEGSVTKKLIKN